MKTKEIWRKVIDCENKSLTDSMGQQRFVELIYLSGSFARGFDTDNSDLDLIMVIHETPYDLLTDIKIVEQHVIDDPDIIGGLAKELKLKHTPKKIDIKIVDLRHFYKELTKGNPNILDAINRGAVCVPVKFKPIKSTLTSEELDQLTSNIQTELNHFQYMWINQIGYVGACFGMALNSKKRINNDDSSMKMVDTIYYFIKIMLPWMPEDMLLKFDLQHNYHQELHAPQFDDLIMREKRHKELVHDAKEDLDNEIETLKKMRAITLAGRNDEFHLAKIDDVRYLAADLFRNELEKNKLF